LVPDLAADGVQRVGGELDHVERVDADGRLGGVAWLGDRLQEGGAHVGGDGGQPGRTVGAEVGEEPVQGGGVGALGAPHDLAGAVVGDQRQVAVALAPGDLVDAGLEQLLEPVRVEPAGGHPLADHPNGPPGDPDKPRHRGLVHAGRQPRHQVLDVAGEARLRPGERHLLGAHSVGGTVDPAQPGRDDQPEAAKVQVAPRGVHRASVVARPGRVLAVRAHEPAAAQRDRDGDLRRLERDLAHGGTGKGQKAVACGSDAHGQGTSGLGLGHLQPYGLACARRASEPDASSVRSYQHLQAQGPEEHPHSLQEPQKTELQAAFSHPPQGRAVRRTWWRGGRRDDLQASRELQPGVHALWVSAKGAVDNDLVQSALEEGELLIIELGDEQR